MPATPAWPPKSLPRLFVRTPLGEGSRVELDAQQANYLGNVLRLKEGAELLVFDGSSGEWLARIAETGRKRMTLSVERKTREPETIPDVWLAFAPVKRQATDWLVEKATELGAAQLIPVITQRTIAERVKLERLEAIAIEAAEQCGRTTLPEIGDPRPLAQFLDSGDPSRTLYFADEGGGSCAPLLHDRGDRWDVKRSLAYLESHQQDERGALALSLAIICLSVYGSVASAALAAMDVEWRRAAFLGNLHVTRADAIRTRRRPSWLRGVCVSSDSRGATSSRHFLLPAWHSRRHAGATPLTTIRRGSLTRRAPMWPFCRPIDTPPTSAMSSTGAFGCWTVDVRGKRVVLKPNLVEYHRDKVINTNPHVVAARRSSCAGARAPRGRSSPRGRATGATSSTSSRPAAWATCCGDYRRAVRRSQSRRAGRRVNLGRLTGLRASVPAGDACATADVVVSMPKLKTHHWAGATLSLKNLFGACRASVYGWPKNELHWRGIENSIVDIAATRTPDLAIVDGIVGMEGDGPLNGHAAPVGCW